MSGSWLRRCFRLSNLSFRYGIVPASAQRFKCPYCRNICNCSKCMKRAGLAHVTETFLSRESLHRLKRRRRSVAAVLVVEGYVRPGSKGGGYIDPGEQSNRRKNRRRRANDSDRDELDYLGRYGSSEDDHSVSAPSTSSVVAARASWKEDIQRWKHEEAILAQARATSRRRWIVGEDLPQQPQQSPDKLSTGTSKDGCPTSELEPQSGLEQANTNRAPTSSGDSSFPSTLRRGIVGMPLPPMLLRPALRREARSLYFEDDPNDDDHWS